MTMRVMIHRALVELDDNRFVSLRVEALKDLLRLTELSPHNKPFFIESRVALEPTVLEVVLPALPQCELNDINFAKHTNEQISP